MLLTCRFHPQHSNQLYVSTGSGVVEIENYDTGENQKVIEGLYIARCDHTI